MPPERETADPVHRLVFSLIHERGDGMSRKIVAWLLILVLSFCCCVSLGEEAEEETEAPAETKVLNEKDYIGTMRVVNCKEWVSLREKASQNTDRLVKVPLGELVYDCYKDVKGFVYCQYQGTYGYILNKYLEKVSGALKPGDDIGETRIMTMEEILENDATVILDWSEYNVQVVAAREEQEKDGTTIEVLRVGCFLDEEAVWGFETEAEKIGEQSMVRAFMGGSDLNPQVMVYNGIYGLSMLDLLSGRVLWTMSAGVKYLGDAAVIAVNEDDGTMYIAGTEGPMPTAISVQGRVLWESVIRDKSVYEPFEIILGRDNIQVKFRSGLEDGYKLVTLDYTGTLLRITEIKANALQFSQVRRSTRSGS